MNRTLLSSISLLSLLIASNDIAMEKEDAGMHDKIVELKTFLDKFYDPKKYYASNSPEIITILPTVKKFIAQADADKNSREENALAVACDGISNIEWGWWPASNTKTTLSLLIVKRYGLNGVNKKAIDATLPPKERELPELDVKEIFITSGQLGKLCDISRKMNDGLNVSETFGGNPTNRKDFSDALDKLPELYKYSNGMTIKGRSLDSVMEEINAKN
jgi:hypothetical protein